MLKPTNPVAVAHVGKGVHVLYIYASKVYA